MAEQPSFFLTHGAGPSFFMDGEKYKWCKGLDKNSKAARFFQSFVETVNLEKPSAILVVSAHWEEKICTIQTNSKPELYYDYGGFPPETYKLTWEAKGSPDIAKQAIALLESNGIKCQENDERGYDHGVFVPLKQIFPKAEIPVFQVSLLRSMNIADNMRIGEALEPLRKNGVLIIGSGSATHAGIGDNKTAEWAQQFQKWIHDVITNPNYTPEKRKSLFLDCNSLKFMQKAHPRIEHFLPIAMACAASGYKAGKILHSEFVGSLLNEHYMF